MASFLKVLESEKELKYYTDMNIIMNPFKENFIKYNWLINDYECNWYPKELAELRTMEEYIWTSGTQLYKIIESNEIQFIWAVFSGFDKNIPFDKIMEYGLPESEYYNHWENKKDLQNPLADVEMVSWDSGCLLFKSKNEKYINQFKKHFPLSKEI
jgi:hypothetical protein